MAAFVRDGLSVTDQRKTLLKYLLVIASAYFSFLLTVFIIALCLGLGPYMSLVARAKLLGDRTAVIRDVLAVDVPRGWAVNNADHGTGHPVPSVAKPKLREDIFLLIGREQRALWRMRRGGACDALIFFSEEELYSHVSLSEEFKWWLERPERWDRTVVGGIDAAYVYTYPKRLPESSTYVGTYVIIPEKDMVLSYFGLRENWELWKELLADGEWLERTADEAAENDESACEVAST